MKKITLVTLCLSFLLFTACSQDVKKNVTEIEKFAPSRNSFLKIMDYDRTELNLIYGSASTRVRRISNSSAIGYFLHIIKTESNNEIVTASIAYDDLIKVIEALQTLKQESEIDLALKLDYVEKEYITDEGFVIGYRVYSEKLKWFLQIPNFDSEYLTTLEDFDSFETILNSAKIRIEQLKSNDLLKSTE